MVKKGRGRVRKRENREIGKGGQNRRGRLQ